MKSKSQRNLGSRLMAILLSAVMTCSVLTPTSIFAAPAPLEAAAKSVEEAAPEVEEILSDAADEADAAVLQATSLTPSPIEEAEALPATIGSYQRRNGYFTYQVTVGDGKREAEVYIPEYARQREYWVVIALPNDVDSVEFMNTSGWLTAADNTLSCLLILKPQDKTWGTFDEEMPYVNACMNTLASNGTYYSAFTYDYLVGYGEGCQFLQLWAASNPLKMISQAYVGATSSEEFLTRLQSAGNTRIGETPQPNHMDFIGWTSRGSFTEAKDKDGNPVTQKRTFEALYNKDLAIPTYFQSDKGKTDTTIAQYWLDVNHADYTPDMVGTGLGYLYVEDDDSNCVTTSFSDVKSVVAINEYDGNYTDHYTTTRVVAFLQVYSGYDNNSAYGHFITYRLDYGDAIQNGNLVYRNHDWNGTNRVYEIYIPEKVKKINGPVPVVFANHGAGQTAFVFMEATDISTAADKYGFVAVTFDLTGNADYMVDLIELVKTECAELGVLVDESRLYAYGQSAGGGATANTLAQNPKTVDRFAAFGYTSGTQATAQKDGVDSVVPVYAIYGEYDYWPNKLGPLEAGEWCGSQGANQAAWTTNTQSYWANRLLGMTLDELIDPANYTLNDGISAVYEAQNTPIDIIVNPTPEANRYKTYTWYTETADGKAPIFVWSQCYGRGHNLVPSDLGQLWENWFSKWQLADDATLYYEDGVGSGEPISVTRSKALEAKDLDAIESVANDLSVSALLPVKGWYTKAIDVNGDGEMNDGRTVKVYASQYAACRAYFTVVAVPDGVDTYEFLKDEGWIDLIESRGEVLIALEPGEGGWGSVAEEQAYINAAMAFANSGNNAKGVNLLSNYSTFYFVGYGNGAGPLESWAAETPIYVGSQAYINGTSAGEAYLTEVGAKIYDGTNTGGYDPGIADLDEFKAVLNSLGYDDVISRDDVAVPTWFAGYAANDYSIGYWKKANDTLATADADGVFWQDINSDAFQTQFANDMLGDAEHGISAVKVTESYNGAEDIASFLYGYSRYNIPFAYSNHISERQDYTAARVAAQKAAEKVTINPSNFVAYDEPYTANSGTVYEGYNMLARERSRGPLGTYESGIFAVADNNKDGVLDATEYLMYIPDCVDGETPVVIQFPGATQSVSVGFDSTQWWRVANEYGVIVVILSECYSATSIRLGWNNADVECNAVRDVLARYIDGVDADIDWTRIYGSGHSAGSSTVQSLIRKHGDWFAAIGSTSFSGSGEGDYTAVPDMLVCGHSDLPFLMKDLWTASRLQDWFAYMAQANGLKVAQTESKEDADFVDESGRFRVYMWNNKQEIPMLVWGQTMLREHNCYPYEVQMAWGYVSMFKREADGSRYYSPSGFAEDDVIEIDQSKPAKYEGTDFDSYTEALATDYSQAAQLPLTGYFYKVIGEEGNRVAHLYFAEDASIRTYFTVVAVPDGVDTEDFLTEQGWFDVADAKGEALLILEPGEGGWGEALDELWYVNEAINFVKSGQNANRVAVFSCFGEFYLAGYGKGADALDAWASFNPIFVISQAYFGGNGVSNVVYTMADAIEYDKDKLEEYLDKVGFEGQLKNSQIPVPTWFGGYAADSTSTAHWKAVNDIVGEADANGIFYQDINSKAFATEYANKKLAEHGAKHGFSEVRVTDGEASAAEIYQWLATFTRYDNTLAYSNALAYRMDYTAATVEVQQTAKAEGARRLVYLKTGGETGTVDLWGNADVHVTTKDDIYSGTVNVGVMAFADNDNDGTFDPREYITYIPDSVKDSGKAVPVVMSYAGNSQTDRIFFDCTLWYQLADENGFIVIFPCETYNRGGVTVSHYNNDLFYYSMKQVLIDVIGPKYGFVADTTRFYGTGQSAGSGAVQGFVRSHPEFFAAVASTSSTGSGNGTQPVPDYLITGKKDNGNSGLGIPESTSLVNWAKAILALNKIDDPECTNPSFSEYVGRYKTQGWNNEQGITLVKYSLNTFRPHNCYPEDMALLWDFMKSFKVTSDQDGVLTHYYSASGYAEDDAVVVTYPDGPLPYPAEDFDAIESANVDLGKSALVPLSGYYTKAIDVDGTARSVKLYFSDYTACRAFYTVVAVPDGVETHAFLEEQGWLDLVNERGEGLMALEPGEGGWGSAAEEAAYVNAAMSFINSGRNAKNVQLFTHYGTYYFVGYGKGAAPLEAWAADYPIWVGSQAYIGGQGAGQAVLDEAGAKIYDGTNTGGYDPGIKDLDEFKAVLKSLGYDDVISRKDVPVPTWFDNYADTDYSITYWKAANDTAATADGQGYFWQDIHSDAFQTEYANDWRARSGEDHGLSAVRVTTANGTPSARELASFLYSYSRYNTPFAYSNHISERQDYTAARVAAQKEAARKAIDESTFCKYDQVYLADSGTAYEGYNLLSRARSNGENGVFESGIFATADDNKDGKLDAREYLMYIPDSVGETAPVVVQFPGMTQSVAVGFDSTQWWRIADEYGVIVVILGEVYNNGVALSWKNADTEFVALMDVLEDFIDGKDTNIDWTRIYGSGHSLGSAQVQTFVHTHPDFFAAVASTSFGSQNNGGNYDTVPTMLATGQADLPFLMKDLWTSSSLQTWFNYLAIANDLKVAEATPDNADVIDIDGRYKMYTWNNKQGIPMVVYDQTYLREHNCYPKEVEFSWEFLSKYCKDNSGRYYSASAFADDDVVKIEKVVPVVDPIEEYVRTLYEEFLGRDADEKGLAEWVALLKDGSATLAQVVKGFVLSPEFINNGMSDEDYVTALYHVIFSREPDQAGLKSWVDVLENGSTKRKVLAGFVNSTEMKALAEELGVEAGSYKSSHILDQNYGVTSFVARLYRVCLGRKYDEAGLTAWVTALLDGSATGSKVARNFLISKEMTNKNLNNEEFLRVCYRALFDREADQAGLNSWLAAMAKGADRRKVVEGFTGSQEFIALCARYGIRR